MTSKRQRIWDLETLASFTGGVNGGSTQRLVFEGPVFCLFGHFLS